jgi:hypothetical protein
VPAAFQPDVTEKAVQAAERGGGGHFDVQPVAGITLAFDDKVEQLAFFPLAAAHLGIVVGETPGQVAGHGHLGERTLAQVTGPWRLLSGHVCPSVAVPR